MNLSRFLSLFILMIAAIASGQQFTEPGWFPAERANGEAIPPEESRESEEPAEGGQSQGQFSLLSFPEIAEAITPEIQALARGLENDPKRIFDWVHDHIRYVHYFGAKKGAQLTLLERSGNDFDQCALLVALLRAAGHTATYRFGRVFMPYDRSDWWDFKHWLGLTKPNTNLIETLNFAHALNNYRGFPYSNNFTNGNDIIFHHVWVLLDWNETTYALDPAFKINVPITGIDLAAAMQLSTNTLMTTAGGTSTADYVQTLSESSLRDKLRDYTTNFLSYIQANDPNAEVEDVIGGQYIESSAGLDLDEPLAFGVILGSTTNWNYIPTNLMATLTVEVAGTNRLLFMPELQGQRLSLTFSNNGVAQLWLDDNLVLQKQTSGGATVDVALAVDHPHGWWDFLNNTLVDTNWNDHAASVAYQRTNASYAITYAFEPDPDWLRQRQERLDDYRQRGLSDDSREVMTETLNIMGLNWMIQTEWMNRLLAPDQQMLVQFHHRLGRMAQETGKGYYIDAYMQVDGTYGASGNNASDRTRRYRFFDWESYLASAAEHGLIEQLQSSNLVAASTIKMLHKAGANGQKVFMAKANNWMTGSNVKNQLTNYSAQTLTDFGNYITAGYTILLPQNGSNTIAGAGTWAGYGAVLRGVAAGNQIQMLISGKYNGAFVSSPTAVPDSTYLSQAAASQPDRFAANSAFTTTPYAGDPVSMVDGSFRVSMTDLSIGGAEPRGFTFSRHYSSSRRHHNQAAMAHGWIHNYFFNLAEVSAPMAGLGTTTAAHAAPMIVAAKASLELYVTNGPPKNWMVTALIAKWGIDQLISNAVSVSLGPDTLQFIRQPNGTFTPPAGSTMILSKSGSAYNLSKRHGNTFKFSSVGLLTNIVDQHNQVLTLTHDPSSNRVSQVKDWKNRTLTFSYSGSPQRLTSITDNTGRSVSYGYTQGDLTSVTDPESKTSTFVYDTNHQVIATLNALSRIVTSNRYDDFGRVIEQYSQGDTNQTWQLYWSGHVNTEEDPIGARKRYFYDDKHRLSKLQDALGRYTDFAYDGQDHVISARSALNEITDFYFDHRQNLTNTVDPLGAPKDFFYDSQDNLVRIWDERGNNSYFGYNAKFQLTGSTNNSGDWATYTYNSTDGNITTQVDAGGTTTYTYDSWGQLSAISYPNSLGNEGFLNSGFGDVLSRTNARNFVTSFQYNARRELTNTIAPTNLTASVAYDAVGNVSRTTDARSFSSSNTWSATRNLLATTLPSTPQGVPVITNAYDRRDWLSKSVNSLQQATLFTNDAAHRLISVSDGLLRTTKFSYDEVGRQIGVTNAANEVTRQIWNPRSELIQTTDPVNYTVKRAYDAAGNQIILTNRNGKKWQFQFDAANRLTNTITPLGRETRLTYNNRGLVSTVREPSTQTSTNLYDAKGRLTNRADQVASTAYRHDANNNVTNIVEAGKTNAWTFDAYDRAASYRDAEGNLIQYAYDQNGNLTNLVYPGGKNVLYVYDSLNRLTNVTDWANRKTSIEYDLASRVKKITRPNGTVREMNYDVAGQTTNIIERTAANVPIAFLKLNWNAAARVQWEFIAPLPHAYTPPTRTMTYDDDNRILTFNSASVTYDLDGNLTNGPLTNNTLGSYVYDARNRLLSAGGLSYAYDPAGNRTSLTNSGNVTKFVINPNAALSQVLLRVKGGVTNYYVYGLGLLYEADDAGNTKTYHYDSRGSTIAITDSSGAVTDRIEYSAYGTTTYRAGTTDTPFLYNGRYGIQTDPNGLLHMRARYYNPYLCRFLNPDPIGFSGGLNFYAYADGNPVSLLDPFGLGSARERDVLDWLFDTTEPIFMDTAERLIAKVRPEETPEWTHPISAAVGLGHIGLENLNGFINWAERQLGIPQDATLLLPLIGHERAMVRTFAAGETRTAVMGDHIVLGLERHGLQQTATQVGGRTLLNDVNWQSTLQTAVGNPSTRFTINLDGVTGTSTYSQFMGAAQRGLAPGATPFNWEMGQIYQAGRHVNAGFVRDLGTRVAPNPFTR